MNKRILFIFFATLILLSFAACDQNSQPPVQISENFSTPPSQADSGVMFFPSSNSTSIDNEDSTSDIAPDNNLDIEFPVDNTIDVISSTTPKPNNTNDLDTAPSYTPSRIPAATSYEQYNAMSGEEQQEFIDSFDSIEAFVAWYNAAQEDYTASRKPIDVTTGVIEIGGTN